MVEPVLVATTDEARKHRAYMDALLLRTALAAALPYAEQITGWKHHWSDRHGCTEVSFQWRDAQLFCQLNSDSCQNISVTGRDNAAAILMQELLRNHFLAMQHAILVG